MKLLRAILVFAAGTAAFAQTPSEEELFATRTFQATRLAKPILVDGQLLESEWPGITPIELAFETNPGNNIAAPVKTLVYLGYDDAHFYAAFRAFDPDPSKIRAHLADRDNAFSDDFIGIVLDTFNDQRRAFEFFVNPLGVQMDLTNDDVGGSEDESWDAIWSSAARVDEQGYVVELAIPFSSLRFKNADGPQTWGIDMVRIWPRDNRRRIGLHPQNKNRACYVCQFSKLTGVEGIRPGKNIELDPTLTTHRTDVRNNVTGNLGGGKFDFEPGLTAAWGMTPNLTLNAAINPDFSQVEADAVQLDINTQFVLSFAEKRPFFLEGADFFTTPLSVVYTRTIADPKWGLKLTGKEGRHGGGLFITQDALTNLTFSGPERSPGTSLADENLSAVFRYRFDLGKNSTLGAIATNRSGGGYANRVAGVDGLFRLGEKDSITAQYIQSSTKYPDRIVTDFAQPDGTFSDDAWRFRYRHSSRNWYWHLTYEDIGERFRSDTGFMPRVGYSFANSGVERTFWPEKKHWYSRLFVGGDWDRTTRFDGQQLEEEVEVWSGIFGPRQSFIFLGLGTRDRFFNGRAFPNEKFLNFFAEVSPTTHMYTYFEVNRGDHIDFANTRPADRLRLSAFLRYNLGRHVRLEGSQTRETLDVEGGRLFTADVTELRTIYQFNVRMFVRLLLQNTTVRRNPSLYDNPPDAKTQRLFPQLLFSYKLNPQTVLFAGYSSTRLGDSRIDLTERDRTFFIKVGYAWML